MNVITDNYIWFIICGFVLLMITVGYYAEKTGFGKKRIKDAENDDSFDSQINSASSEQILIGDNIPVQELLNVNNNFDNNFLKNVNEINNNSSAVSSSDDDIKIDIFDSNTNVSSSINDNDNDIWKF